MESLPIELLLPILRTVADEWPFASWSNYRKVICSTCAAIAESTHWSSSHLKCNTPSIQPPNFPPRHACHTTRLGWVNLTFVCSTWRDILIHTPDLWTAIDDFMGVDCVRAFCTRSGDKPVRLQWHAYDSTEAKAMELAVQIAHDRVYHLEVDDMVLQGHSTVFWESAMPQLRHLALHKYEKRGIELITVLHTENLQELVLSAKPGAKTWDFFKWPTLQKLSMNFENDDDTSMAGMLPGLLTGLRHLNTLQELRLNGLTVHNGFNINREKLNLVEPVAMNCTVIELSGDQRNVDDLISVLVLPPLARLKLSGELNPDSPTEPSVFGTHRALTRANGFGPERYTSCTFDINVLSWTLGETWQLRASRGNLRESGSSSNDDFTITWDGRACETLTSVVLNRAAVALSGICASLESGVRELCLIQNTATPSANLRQVYHDCFASWALVDRLCVTGTVAAHGIIDGLLSRRISDNQLVFPRLRVLELVDVNWEVAADSAEEMCDSLGAKLSKVLQERHEAGKSLELLLVPDIEVLNATSWLGALRGVARVEQV